MTKFLIFDFDGVLVDSEILASTVEAQVKTEMGFPTTVEDQIHRFTGTHATHPVQINERKRLPENYVAVVQQRVYTKYKEELKPIAGTTEFLSQLKLPRALASSSSSDGLEFKLAITNLKKYFGDHVFNNDMVANCKPAPDLYLHALKTMGWKAEDGYAIEDSEPGVRSARGAGLRVIGFIGGGHVRDGYGDRLIAAGAQRLIKDLRELIGKEI
jgi:HAD superfamily hydrolase (TIGR01509 family)